MRNIVFLLFAAFVFFSCSKKSPIPEKLTQKFILKNTSESVLETNIFKGKMDALVNQVNYYQNNDLNFNLKEFKRNWDLLKEEQNSSNFNEIQIRAWIISTELLFELTADAKYTEELERVSGISEEYKSMLESFTFTKNVDHIHVNLFNNQEIEYEHTLHGKVKIRQETDYPKSGSVRLHFDVEERKYIELNIRIPEWAEGSSVIVKQVRYLAIPGEYCKIAKKWKEGDLVEIEFPVDKIPKTESLVSAGL